MWRAGVLVDLEMSLQGSGGCKLTALRTSDAGLGGSGVGFAGSDGSTVGILMGRPYVAFEVSISNSEGGDEFCFCSRLFRFRKISSFPKYWRKKKHNQSIKMSATITDNPITTTIQQDYLHDYQIRLSGGVEEAFSRSNEDSPPPAAENPPDWYDQHRQVPPYRPVNRNLDIADRPWGSNGVESAFVFVMLNGCWLKGVRDAITVT